MQVEPSSATRQAPPTSKPRFRIPTPCEDIHARGFFCGTREEKASAAASARPRSRRPAREQPPAVQRTSPPRNRLLLTLEVLM